MFELARTQRKQHYCHSAVQAAQPAKLYKGSEDRRLR